MVDVKKRYAALDFETMDTWRATVCQVSCVIFEDGKVVDKYTSLIKPPSRYENPFCVEVHGIRYCDVENSPSFDEVWPQIDEMIGDCKIIAHNAPFEKSCLKACNEEFGTKCDYEFIDTLKISRKYLNEMCSHSLDSVCWKLGVTLNKHHDAEEDAVACGEVFFKLKEKYKLED